MQEHRKRKRTERKKYKLQKIKGKREKKRGFNVRTKVKEKDKKKRNPRVTTLLNLPGVQRVVTIFFNAGEKVEIAKTRPRRQNSGNITARLRGRGPRYQVSRLRGRSVNPTPRFGLWQALKLVFENLSCLKFISHGI